MSVLDLSLEHNPKWETLNEILIEVERDDESKDTQSTVLILVESRYTVTQLKEVIFFYSYSNCRITVCLYSNLVFQFTICLQLTSHI